MKFDSQLTVMRASRREYTDRNGDQKELHEAVVLTPEDELMTVGVSALAFPHLSDAKNVKGTATLEVASSEQRGRAFVHITRFVADA